MTIERDAQRQYSQLWGDAVLETVSLFWAHSQISIHNFPES